jgi:hypothetical protein
LAGSSSSLRIELEEKDSQPQLIGNEHSTFSKGGKHRLGFPDPGLCRHRHCFGPACQFEITVKIDDLETKRTGYGDRTTPLFERDENSQKPCFFWRAN